jgi:hypothetical protein
MFLPSSPPATISSIFGQNQEEKRDCGYNYKATWALIHSPNNLYEPDFKISPLDL